MNKLIFLMLFLSFFSISQGQNNKKSTAIRTENLSKSDRSFVPKNRKQLYFPLEATSDSSVYSGLSVFKNTWYSKCLYAMREPLIFMTKSQNEIYRFTWLRTFDNPVAIRVEKSGNLYLLFWKLCDGAGGYKPGHLTVDKQKPIDKQTWDTFKDKLSEIGFWNLMANEKDVSGYDGSQWILEGKTPEQYHVVDKWTPRESTKYYECCDFLIGLTDLKINDKDKY